MKDFLIGAVVLLFGTAAIIAAVIGVVALIINHPWVVVFAILLMLVGPQMWADRHDIIGGIQDVGAHTRRSLHR